MNILNYNIAHRPTYIPLDRLYMASYRDLQKVAKRLRLPANCKSKDLLTMIAARLGNNEGAVVAIMREIYKRRSMKRRITRFMTRWQARQERRQMDPNLVASDTDSEFDEIEEMMRQEAQVDDPIQVPLPAPAIPIPHPAPVFPIPSTFFPVPQLQTVMHPPIYYYPVSGYDINMQYWSGYFVPINPGCYPRFNPVQQPVNDNNQTIPAIRNAEPDHAAGEQRLLDNVGEQRLLDVVDEQRLLDDADDKQATNASDSNTSEQPNK